MKKINVAIIFGGCSTEYSVSLQSAYAVIRTIDKEKYAPILIGISKQGNWFCFLGDKEKIANDTWCNSSDCVSAMVSPNREHKEILLFRNNGIEKHPIDIAFPILHGKNGEDGTVQGLFEIANIPIIGCGILCSALCMDKDKAHKLVNDMGIRVPKSFIISGKIDMDKIYIKIKSLGFPVFVKPVKAGSSYGITKVEHQNQFTEAIRLAFLHDDKVIIEEYIEGFEVGCAILGNDDLTIGEVDEIELSSGFFDFNEKYTLKTSKIHVPARISKETSEKVKQAAEHIYHALDCKDFARVDMFLTPLGEIVFNEVNTIPGFTSHSRFPNMLKAVGMNFEDIISELIELMVKT